MGFFISSKKEIWAQFASEIGANYHDGGFLNKDYFSYQYKNWNFDLHTYTQSNGQYSSTYTRLRVPFITKENLQLNIYEEGFFSTFGKLFNMQDIQIHDTEFDKRFIIKGNNELKIRQLLNDTKLKQAFLTLKEANVKIDNGRSFLRDRYPENVNALVFECSGIINQLDNLHKLFTLFKLMLDGLVRIRSIETASPAFSFRKEA